VAGFSQHLGFSQHSKNMFIFLEKYSIIIGIKEM
jgi:hypothetical protein